MARGHISYDPNTGSVGAYAPRFRAVNPDSFMEIVRAAQVAASRAEALDNAPEASPVGRLNLGAGTTAYLGKMRSTETIRQIRKDGAERFFKGKHRSDLNPQLRNMYDQVQKAQKDAGIKENLVGGLGKVIDVLSTFNYASAEAVSRVWRKSMESDDESWLENLGEAFVDAGKGFVSGVKHNDKTTYSKVIQQMLDSKEALKDGKDPNKVRYGYAELSGGEKFLKGAAGFTFDVLLDPTTYLGVGVVKSAIKGGVAGTKATTKSADDLAENLFENFGVKINDIDDVAPLKGFLNQSELVGPVGRVQGASAEARSARIKDTETFIKSTKATVAAKETARWREVFHANRANDYVKVPVDEVTESGPRLMDVPATAEDLAAYHRYTRLKAANSSKRSGASPQQIAVLDRELADLERKFKDYFNVTELDAEKLAKTNAKVLDHADVKRLDQQIRVKRDEVRKRAAHSKNAEGVVKARQELDELLARREGRINELIEDAAAKVAPDKGTLVSKVRRESDISILRQLSEANLDDGVIPISVLRRELAYRFAEKGDKWLAQVVAKAGSLSDGLVDDVRNLTPLKRPGKHTIKRRQIVVEETPTKPVSKKDILKAEAHNRKIDKEVEAQAIAKAKEIADGIENQLLEIMVRETTPNFKRGLAIKVPVPFTKKNTPQTANVLFALALPDAVSKAVSKYVFRDTFKEGFTRWANFFKSSAGTDPLLNQMRLAYNGGANFRIEEHAKRLRTLWQGVAPAERRAAFRQWLQHGHLIDENATGPYAEMVRQIDDEVKRVTAIFNTSYPDGAKITPADFNKWLPEKMQLQKLDVMDSKLPLDEKVRAGLRHTLNEIDPAELLWHMNIAREKVLVRQAMKDNVRHLFGIERHADNESMVKKLIREYGYKEVPELGPQFVFPTDIADDIVKTFDLMKNQRAVNELIGFYDSLLTVYKSTVTMYNPGYHMRNSFGDSFMNYLAGVSGKSGLESYRHSAKIIKALKGMGDDNPIHAALMDINPKAAFAQIENKPNTVLWTTPRGKKVTAEEVWVLYNHYGLHSGFVANEFATGFGKPGTLRATSVGRKATDTNRAVQSASEHREDFFRLAHFIHAMKQSKNPNLDRAAFDAAESVRKYLFDYSDFTQVEKAVMLRLIPFYKWTRKAIPLMAETMFAQPGKALLYPKAMRNISAAMGYDLGDNNGVIPSSDVIIPEWVRNRGMYPLGEQDGNTVMGDVALPFNDVVRTVSSPLDSFFSMLTPGVRIPVEMKMGKRFYGDIPIYDKTDYASSSIPQGSFLQQMLKKNEEGEASGISGNLTDPRTIQFLSGIGLHENTDRQMENELRRASFEASKANRKRKEDKK